MKQESGSVVLVCNPRHLLSQQQLDRQKLLEQSPFADLLPWQVELQDTGTFKFVKSNHCLFALHGSYAPIKSSQNPVKRSLYCQWQIDRLNMVF